MQWHKINCEMKSVSETTCEQAPEMAADHWQHGARGRGVHGGVHVDSSQQTAGAGLDGLQWAAGGWWRAEMAKVLRVMLRLASDGVRSDGRAARCGE